MSIQLLLIPLFLLCCLGSYFSYSEDLRRGRWFLPVTMAVTFFSCMCWYWVVRELDDKKKMFVFSLVWDSLILAAYYLFPMMVFEMKMGTVAMIGAALVIVGLMVVKFSG